MENRTDREYESKLEQFDLDSEVIINILVDVIV
jgi:hypothetical protein